ncbi:CMDH [Symbiodinium natans]|uniref:Malate dehydrogenase n=1 Tax=Symbiodinium natans TaxID=878477 RepID=A0A812T818_9DINO|nr:CMDH [Symbiodinium natans]
MGAAASRDTACLAGMMRSSRPLPSSAEPITVTICGAAGQIGYSLLPMIASGGMFGPSQRVNLQCLDLKLPEVMDSMHGMEMELQDGNFPLLHKSLFTTDDALAFKGADYAILLGAFPRQDGLEKRDVMEKNVMIFRTMGRALERHVKYDCKVLVVGNPAHTNAWVCAHYAPSLPKQNFFALTRLDQNRAAGQIAHHFGISVNEVKNVVAWGSHAKFPDIEHAIIKGKPATQALSTMEERKRINDLFRKEMQQRGASIVKARKASSAMSTARAIVDHIHDLHCGTQPGEFVSMGVWSDHGAYSIGDSLVFSVPVICYGGGRYRVHPSLSLSSSSRDKLRQVEAEIAADRDFAKQFMKSSPGPSAPSSAS